MTMHCKFNPFIYMTSLNVYMRPGATKGTLRR